MDFGTHFSVVTNSVNVKSKLWMRECFKEKGSLKQGTNRKGMKKIPWGGGRGNGEKARGGGNGGDRDILYSVKITSMVEIYFIIKCR